MTYKKFIFLSGTFTGLVSDFVHLNSNGTIQNAANVFQLNLIRGFLMHRGVSVAQVNLPFVGSYPGGFSKLFFPAFRDVSFANHHMVSPSFLNLVGVRLLSRFFSSLKTLFKLGKDSGCDYVVVYSAHLPFVLAALFYKLFHSKVFLVMVIPDLPEYMKSGGFLYSSLKKIDSFIFRSLLKFYDWYIVLTLPMAHSLSLPSARFVVIEGVADETNLAPKNSLVQLPSFSGQYIFYSGTLDLRYGIGNLLAGFELSLNDHNLSLVICGAGEGQDLVMSFVARLNRVHYFGQLPRESVLSIQKSAYALINPRQPLDEFTNYSFPSKIMEYFLSGRPVIMYKLGGIPDDYDGLYFSPDDLSVNMLSSCISRVASMLPSELDAMGERARSYVIKNKSSTVQVDKILRLIGVV